MLELLLLVGCAGPPPWTLPADTPAALAPGEASLPEPEPLTLPVRTDGARVFDLRWDGEPEVATGWGLWRPSAHTPTAPWQVHVQGPVPFSEYRVGDVHTDAPVRSVHATGAGWVALQFPSGSLDHTGARTDVRALDVAELGGVRWVIDRARAVRRGEEKVVDGGTDLQVCGGQLGVATRTGFRVMDGGERTRSVPATHAACAPDGWLVAWGDQRVERLDASLEVVGHWRLPPRVEPPEPPTPGWTRSGNQATDGERTLTLPAGTTLDVLTVDGDRVAAAYSWTGLIVGFTGERPFRIMLPTAVQSIVFRGQWLFAAGAASGVHRVDLRTGEQRLLRLPRMFHGHVGLCTHQGKLQAAWSTAGLLELDPEALVVTRRFELPGDTRACGPHWVWDDPVLYDR